MRKVVITLETDLMSNLVPNSFFEAIEYIEGKAILKVNLEIGVKIAVCDIKTNPGFTLEDIEFPDEWAILDVLKKTDNIYTILLKTEYRNGMKFQQLYNEEYFKKIRNLLEMDIIFDLPFILTEKKLVLAFSVNNEVLKEFLDAISILGDIKNISFQPAAFSDYTILSCLTERQREVITVAKKSGYYDVPRKVNAEELSKKLGVSRATITEHLRKAEQRIIKNILAGY